MAAQYSSVCEDLTVHPHEIALPYRGEGVARALRDTFIAVDNSIPSDMIMLLKVLDDPVGANGPG